MDALWDEQRYIIATALLVLSGIWPYVKLSLTLLLVAGRKWWPGGLRVVEVLGKWNHLDLLVCALLIVVLRIYVTVDQLPAMGE